ncbi:hypothetical protein IV73_GL000141 [Weissella kandleri]|uniref:Uncharacterized protein n=2 Tax=Weissella kandleri TaxID=1616 RepID=A0A0R2JE45_9LACO|nr:hypothetical protein IV73_GL000141 [Weissella kandleri]
MPSSTQNLYWHLGQNADDDGVVEAYNVINLIGAKEDDLRLLVTKDFVKVLNEDLVVFITDWRENNRIRSDRKIDSIYKDLLLQIMPDVELLSSKPRADAKPKAQQSVNNQLTSTGRPDDNQRSAQVRLGKVRLGQVKDDDDDEYNQSLEIQKSPEIFPKTTIAELLAENPQVEGLVNDLFSDLIVDNPDQAFEAINAVVGQYWRLRTLLDDGNEVLILKEQVHGKGQGILAVIKEASEAQLEYMKVHLANFIMFGRYFENGLIDRINTAISSGGISNGN